MCGVCSGRMPVGATEAAPGAAGEAAVALVAADAPAPAAAAAAATSAATIISGDSGVSVGGG